MMFYCYGMHYSVKSGNLYLSFNSFFLSPAYAEWKYCAYIEKNKNCFEPKKHKKRSNKNWIQVCLYLINSRFFIHFTEIVHIHKWTLFSIILLYNLKFHVQKSYSLVPKGNLKYASNRLIMAESLSSRFPAPKKILKKNTSQQSNLPTALTHTKWKIKIGRDYFFHLWLRLNM